MMKRLINTAVAAILFAAAAGAASAEVSLESVNWQVGKVAAGRVASWQNVAVLEDGPPRLDHRLRALLVLKNAGPAEEGLLVRYSMTARVSAVKGGAAEGTWAVPFSVDERRVPKIGADKPLEVPLEASPALDIYLNRLGRAGWWADRIKIQVMLEPRSGSKGITVLEAVFDVKPEAKP
jgi:hypothetical protein